MITQYDFFRTKYGKELLIDLIRFEQLEKYVRLTPVQRLSYYDITVISEGEGTFAIDGFEQQVTKGSVHFSSPGQVRKWNTPKMPKGYVVIFENEFLTTFFNDTRFVERLSFFNSPNSLRLDAGDYEHVVDLLESIEKDITQGGRNDNHMLRALLYQLLVFLSRKNSFANKISRNRYIEKFVQLVNTSHHQQRSVSYYADQLHISVGHLNALAKDHLCLSAKQYIVNCNMLEAKRLLQYTTMGVDEIATSLNYESTSYFVRAFRLHTNFTPLQFRKGL